MGPEFTNHRAGEKTEDTRPIPLPTWVVLSLAVVLLTLASCGTDKERTETTGVPAEQVGTTNTTAPSDQRSLATPDYVMGKETYPERETDRPEKGVPFLDPDFHTPLVRLTDRTSDAYAGPGIQNESSRIDPENCESSLVLLLTTNESGFPYGTYQLYDASGGQLVREIDEVPSNEFVGWDDTDPSLFYYLEGTQLRGYDVSTNQSRPLHDFVGEFPQAELVHTSGNEASADRRYWALMVLNEDRGPLAVVCYDLEKDSIIGSISGHSLPAGLSWIAVSMSGKHVLLGHGLLMDTDTSPETELFSHEFKKQRDLPGMIAYRGDMAQTSEGTDVYVWVEDEGTGISMVDLDSGQETRLLSTSETLWNSWNSSLSVSGNSHRRPGWAFVSASGIADSKNAWMNSQLFALELKDGARVWRIAHTYSYPGPEPQEMDIGDSYREFPAAVNSAGSRIYFSSNWGDLALGYSDTYQVTLPDSWFEVLGGS